MGTVKNWMRVLAAIGDRPEDSDDQRLQNRSLVTMAASMGLAAIAWGLATLALGLAAQTAIPFGFFAVTAANLVAFRRFKNFELARTVQVGFSVLLPFLFQWTFGGFAQSGGVMLWALVALLGSLSFADAAWAARWMVLYTTLVLVSGFVDPAAAGAASTTNLPVGTARVAFVFNALAISWVAFGVTIFLLTRQQRALDDARFAHSQIRSMNELLEEEVAARTAALVAANAENEALIHHVAEGLVGVDAEGILRSANPRVRELLGLEGSPIGRSCDDVLPGEIVRLGRRCHEDGRIDSVLFDTADGRTLCATASPVHSDELKLGCVVTIRDVTLEREIDRMKTDFTATVSHELRTPLTSVLGFAKVIANKLESRVFPHVPDSDTRARRAVDQTRQNLGVIVTEGERLTNLINDMLDISKMEAGKMSWRQEDTSPEDLVHRAVSATTALFRDDGPALREEIVPEAGKIRVDPDRIVQVIINLISNAAKFTEHGSVRVMAHPEDGGVRFAVVDTGSGIPAQALPEVFDKFRQAHTEQPDHPKGTGLGLPICRQIIEAHGGRIEAESQLGVGSTFSFWLPRVPPEGAAVTA